MFRVKEMAYAEAGKWDEHGMFTRDTAGDKTGKEDGTGMHGTWNSLLGSGTRACWKWKSREGFSASGRH